MQQIPLLILAFIIMFVAVKAPAFPEESPSVDKRYQRCLGAKACTAREDLRFLDQMTEAMRNDLRRIEQACVNSHYKDCFNPAAPAVADWHKMHAHMDDIARILETRYATSRAQTQQFNAIEPSAGPNPYTNPDQQQLNEIKKNWWQGEGWTPPEENNPYHKW